MDTTLQTLTVDGKRAGLITVMERHPRFNRGLLRLGLNDDEPIRIIFEAVVKLAANVDHSSPTDYQAAWGLWHRGCDELQDLGLWIGSATGPVEEFTIESNWTVEWTDMDTNDAFL